MTFITWLLCGLILGPSFLNVPVPQFFPTLSQLAGACEPLQCVRRGGVVLCPAAGQPRIMAG